MCHICEQKLISKIGMMDHIRVYHKKTIIYQCVHCNYTHYLKSLFMRHCKYHKTKPVKCTICGFQTIYSSSLKRTNFSQCRSDRRRFSAEPHTHEESVMEKLILQLCLQSVTVIFSYRQLSFILNYQKKKYLLIIYCFD